MTIRFVRTLLSSTFLPLTSKPNTRPNPPTDKRRSKSSANKLGYESLEPRNLLATFVVNTPDDIVADDDLISLREAVTAAETNAAFSDVTAGDADGDQIFFADGLFNLTLTEGELAITDDLIIVGDSFVDIDAEGQNRIFNIQTSEKVVLRNLVLVGGFTTGAGGAIFNNGTGETVLNRVDVKDSIADLNGGGIATENGLLNLITSSVRGNAAGQSGGGIHIASGEARLSEASLFDNSAAANGGSIEIASGTLSIVNNSKIGGSLAANVAALRGGGIHTLPDSFAFINNSSVDSNMAAEGGGIFNQGSLLIRSSIVTGNTATQDGPTTGGGGLNNIGKWVRIENSSIANNKTTGADSRGGGILTTKSMNISNSFLIGNEANGDGGAIAYSGTGRFNAFDLELIANKAGVNNSNGGHGGALHLSGEMTWDGTDILFESNEASQGGAIWINSNSRLTLNNSTISNNSAIGAGLNGGGGGIYNAEGRVLLSQTDIVANSATGLDANGGGIYSVSGFLPITLGSISGNTARGNGGGIELVGGSIRLEGTNVRGNAAGIQNGIESEAGKTGGGINISGSGGYLIASDAQLESNRAPYQGGGIWVQDGATLVMQSKSQLVRNVTNRGGDLAGGGGIFNNGGSVRIFDTYLGDNQSQKDGGAIFSVDGLVYLEGASISSNIAARHGGGIEVVEGILFLRDSLLGGLVNNDGNRAGIPGQTFGSGGGIHVSGVNGTQTVVDNSIVRYNIAQDDGGGIWHEAGSNLAVRNGTNISRNVAQNGGGVYSFGGSMNLNRAHITSNFAINGGGIYALAGSTSRMSQSYVAYNQAQQQGGGIYLQPEFFFVGTAVVFNESGIESPGIHDAVGNRAKVFNSFEFGNFLTPA